MTKAIYSLVYCEADTGIVLNQNGSRWSKDDDLKEFHPSFKSLAEARDVADQLLADNPGGEVSILSNDELLETHRNEEKLSQYLTERNAYYQWVSIPKWLRCFKRKPVCTTFKPPMQASYSLIPRP